MLPALLLVGFGARRRLWLPLPVVLLWPLWFAGWVAWLVLAAVGVSWERPLRLALTVGAHLAGTRVDIQSAKGERIYLRMI
jgi:hypothetical protein